MRKHSGKLFVFLAIIVIAIAFLWWGWSEIQSAINFIWEWMRIAKNGDESHGTTARNIGILIFGVAAVIFASWRSTVAHKQANIAQMDLLNERYQKGAEMLGSEVLSVRLAGIFALQSLAEQHRQEYYTQVMRLLCAFVRHPTGEENDEYDGYYGPDQEVHYPKLREDVQTILHMFRLRDDKMIRLEKESEFIIDLRSANLTNSVLSDSNLSHASLDSTILRGANVIGADLSDAVLSFAHLDDAHLHGANLSDTSFLEAFVSRAEFNRDSLVNPDGENPARGLTQRQIDKAKAMIDELPYLLGVHDAETGHELVWQGTTIDLLEPYTDDT